MRAGGMNNFFHDATIIREDRKIWFKKLGPLVLRELAVEMVLKREAFNRRTERTRKEQREIRRWPKLLGITTLDEAKELPSRNISR
jgi:hypothetical protein